LTLKNTTDRNYFLFLFTAFLVLIAGLGSYGLAETSEARYAEISREMFVYGDYLNPELLGVFHFHKPPITYFITTLGYRIFGINEFGARFFLQVAIVIQLLLVYRIADLMYKNKRIAFNAGLVYFSLPIVLISSRNLTTDAFLTTFIIGAIYSWQVYSSKDKVGFLYLFYMLVGIALLTKGPVALLFILVYIIINKIILKKGMHITVHHVLGFLLCVAIGVSWYAMVMLENPKLWDYFIQKQLLSRVNSNSFNRSKPFWFYIPILFALLLPWWLALVPKFKAHIQSLLRKLPETKVLLYSSIVLFLLFSAFSTKLIMYILPIFWMLAIIISVEVLEATQKTRNIVNVVYAIFLGLLFLGLIVCWFIKPEIIQVSTINLIVALISVIAFAMVYYFIENDKTFKPPVLAGVFGITIILISTSVMAHNSNITNSTRDIVRFIDNVSDVENKMILVNDYLITSIPFYTNDTHITLKSTHNTTDREVGFENDELWKERLWDVKETAVISKLDTLSKKQTTFLLVRNSRGLGNDLVFLKQNFNSHKNYTKWTIYYNK
jgi:4-amino-4-deoxy-L-arabinose transferase